MWYIVAMDNEQDNSTQNQPTSPVTGSLDTSLPQTPGVPPSQPEPVVAPRKARRGLLLIIVLVLLAAVSAAAYWFVSRGDTTDAPSTSIGDEYDLEKALTQYQEEMSAQYKVTISGNDESGLVIVYDDASSTYVGLNSPQGWGATMSLPVANEGQSVSVNDAFEHFTSLFKADGFSEYQSDHIYRDDFNADDTVVKLVRDNHVCQVSTFSSDRLIYNCAMLSQLEPQKKFLEPLYEAYYKEFPGRKDDGQTHLLLANEPEVSDAKYYPGYQTLLASVDQGGIWFYRTVESSDGTKKYGTWQYGYSKGQDMPQCATFDNDGVRKAFADVECYDDIGGRSTVEKYFKLSVD